MAEQFDLFAETPPEPAKETAPVQQSGPRVQYFDLETQKSADEVGGWGNIKDMGLSVGVVWDSVDNEYFSYVEEDAGKLIQKLRSADLVVGFNVKNFDYTVLQRYSTELFHFDLQEIKTFDMLEYVHEKLRHRLSLNVLAQSTLGAEKSADGLVALKWYKEGKMDQIIEYCIKDVEITRDLFLFGEKNGYVEYESRSKKGRQRLPVDWKIESLTS